MSVFQPIDDNVTDFGDLTSVELFAKIAENINYLLDSMPIGTITPIVTNIPGIPAIDPNIWQECDGQNISNSISPLRTHNSPDYADEGRYMRCYDSIGTVGNFQGSNFKNLQHGHGNVTQVNAAYGTTADQDNDFYDATDHTHTINDDVFGIFNFEPEHVRVKHYIKINDTGYQNIGKFKDLEKDFGTTIAQSLWQKASKGINSLNRSYPVGMLLFFVATQDNLPELPDPTYWKLCDGTTVTNPDSPIFGESLPDLREKFIRHPTGIETELSLGGQATLSFPHDHGGITNGTDDRLGIDMDGGGERLEGGYHTHFIGTSLVDPLDITPAFFELQFYMRIV